MSGAAAPAPPTLAAERPRAARERPLTAQRAHLAPSDRRQPPVRFREAPTKHTCSCAHAQPGHTHMHNILHTVPCRTRACTSSSSSSAAATAAAAATAETTATTTTAASQATCNDWQWQQSTLSFQQHSQQRHAGPLSVASAAVEHSSLLHPIHVSPASEPSQPLQPQQPSVHVSSVPCCVLCRCHSFWLCSGCRVKHGS